MAKELVQTRVSDSLADRIEEYQGDEHLNRSEAIRALLRAGLDAEAEADADQEEANPPVATDGGWTVERHPWTAPLIEIGDRMAGYSTLAILASVFTLAIPGGAVEWFGVEPTAQTTALFLSLFVNLFLVGAGFLLIALCSILALEYLMHPMDAPIRRYFPSTWPDHEADADQEEASA